MVIKKEGNKWCLYSHDGSKNLGCYDSEEGAKKRERQVQYFKHKESEIDDLIDRIVAIE
jgi:hypothetical protein